MVDKITAVKGMNDILPPDSARWEQAFSVDRGRSWETNWYMDFRRV